MEFLRGILIKVSFIRKIGVSLKRKWFRKNANSVLLKFKELLGQANVEFWLDYGTLLGAVRENNFLPHDNDIDIGVIYSKENITKIHDIFSKNNITKYREVFINGIISEQTYILKGIKVDIFYYIEDSSDVNNMCTHIFSMDNNDMIKSTVNGKEVIENVTVYKVYFKKRGLEEIVFRGNTYKAPENHIGYLIENYGEDYMIPKTSWNYKTDPMNQVEIKVNDSKVVYC